MITPPKSDGPDPRLVSFEGLLWHGVCASACLLSLWMLCARSFDLWPMGAHLDSLIMAPGTGTVTVLLALTLWRRRTRHCDRGLDIMVSALCGSTAVFVIGTAAFSPNAPSLGILLSPSIRSPAEDYMSLPSALVILLYSLALGLGAIGSKQQNRLIRALIVAFTLFSLFLCVFSVAEFAAGGRILLPGSTTKPTLSGALALCCVGCALLLDSKVERVIRRILLGPQEEERQLGRAEWPRAMLFGLATLAFIGLIIATLHYVRIRQLRHRDLVANDLASITELKALQIEGWQRMRMANALTVRGSPLITNALLSLVRDRDQADKDTAMRRWLALFTENYGYDALVLLNQSLEPVIWSQPLDPSWVGEHEKDLKVALETDQIVETKPCLEKDRRVYTEWIVPISDQDGARALLVLKMDPLRFMGQILSSWQTNLRSAETVLFRIDEGRLAMIGRASRRKGEENLIATASILYRRVMVDESFVLAKIARGDQGLIEGVDRLGEPVFAVGRRIGNTPWYILSKVDKQEVQAPLRSESWKILVNVFVLLAGLALLGALVWTTRRNQILRLQRQAEQRLRRNEERLKFLLTSTPAVIYSVRAGGDYANTFVSDNVFVVTGYSAADFMSDPAFWARRVHPDDLDAAISSLSLASTDRTIIREYRFRHADGTYRWTHDESTLLRDAEGDPIEHVGYWTDVTVQRETIEALRKSRDQLAKAEQMARLGSWVFDHRTQKLSWSDEVFRIFEIDPREFGASYAAFLAAVHPDDRERVDSAFRTSVSERRNYTTRHRLNLFGGRYRIVEESCETSFSEEGAPLVSIGTVQDITEIEEANETLRHFNLQLEEKVAQRTAELVASNREVKALLDSIPDYVVRMKSDGTLIHSQKSKGMGSLDSINLELSGLQNRALDAGKRALHRNDTVSIEVELAIESEVMTTELRATPVHADDFVVFVRDITARRRLETELASTLAKERELSEMKSRFIAVTSHEFRTPMSTALASAELLDRHSDTLTAEKRKELVGRISTALQRINRMLDDLLVLNRMESQQVVVTPQTFNPSLTATNILEEIRLADYGAHEFVFEEDGEAGEIFSDPDLLHHILSNLLNNARRYSPPGSTITLELHSRPRELEFAVRDQGIGVPENDRERLFKPFERGSNVGTIKGTGLGLSIVRRMSVLLGGIVYLDPKVVRGCRFVLILPRNSQAKVVSVNQAPF